MKSDGFPAFDHPVPDTGYQWWYVDATSDCGRHHLVVIAFVGSVFSPHYFRAIGEGRGNPENFCALNVGIYSRGRRRWVLTEYDTTRIQREPLAFALGDSVLRFDGTALLIDINERAVPLPRKVRGRVRVEPRFRTDAPLELQRGGGQCWWPFAPSARVELHLETPSLRWQGEGYFDTNSGAVPLQACFRDWHWSRRHDRDGATHVTYHTRDVDDEIAERALRIDPHGHMEPEPLPPLRDLPRGLWRMPRPIAASGSATLVETLEDAPFYTRSVVTTAEHGDALTMHESLSLEQFVKPWVQRLLPFRTRRKGPRAPSRQNQSQE